MSARFDIAIVGAGMAGASLAAEVAGAASVLLLEAETQPGYHSTGRSAAFWSETYGGPLVQPLTSASGPFLANPPVEFAERSFLKPRGAVHVADGKGFGALSAFGQAFKGSTIPIETLGRAALERMIPGLRSGWDHGLEEPTCTDIDVAALHMAYLAAARRMGVELATDCRLESATRRDGLWQLETPGGTFQAGILVDAAGAWADTVARLAGIAPLGIQPFRRTMVQLKVDPPAPTDLTLVIDALGRFYFKPEAGGRIWLTPHDEAPCVAGDCAPEEYDVALAIDRLQRIVDWRIERVERSWAGLRSFAPDRLPVYGFAPERSDFFWFAGQGGFGIQTAPAAAKMAAALLLGSIRDPMVAGIDPEPYSPARFSAA